MQQQRESLAITWYTRRDGIVRGPFAPAHITRYILLGRIRLDDELSHDRITWRLTRSVATLLPAEMLNLHGWEDYQQLVEAGAPLRTMPELCELSSREKVIPGSPQGR
jgi:hypothetical protein